MYFNAITGGTVDITVHVVNDWGNFKELHQPNGGAWGGTKVDEAYEAFLTNIVGKHINQFSKYLFCKHSYTY
jgi:hypothetical protein